MDRIDRRTFLATGIKTGAALAVIGGAAGVVVDTAGPATATDAGNGSPGPPRHLTVVGLSDPVGVDPDDVQFAWHVVDSRRGAVQSGYRMVVSGPDGSASTVWDSGRVSSSHQAFVGYGGPPLSADARYRWTVSTADGQGRWSQPSAPASFTTGLRTKDWTALWLRPGPADPGAGGVHLPPGHPPPSARDHRPGHGLRGRRPQVPAVGERRPARQRPELLLSRRAVLPGDRHHVGAGGRAPQRRRHPPPLVRAGPGSSDLRPRPPGPGGGALRRRHPGDAPLRRLVADPTGGMAPGTPAQQRRGRLRRVDRRTPASHRMVRGRLRRPRMVGRRRSRTDRIGALRRPLRPAHPDQRAPGDPGGPAGAPDRLGGGRLRQGLRRETNRVVPPRGRRAPRPPPRRLHPRSRRIGLHHPQHPADRSVLLVHPALRRPGRSSPTSTSGSAISRSTIPARWSTDGQVTLLARHASHARRRRRHVHLLGPDARRRVGPVRPLRACTPPRSSSSTRPPGRRASSCGTRPTSPRRSCGPTANRT